MITNEKAIRVFNNLIQTNIDRIEGYEKALNESRNLDIDVKSIFKRMITESRQNNIELVNEVVAQGGDPAQRSSVNSKIYRIWMDVRAAFTKDDVQAILDSCEFGEDAAIEAYENALQSDAELTIGQLNLITRQKAGIQLAHNLVKRYRDMHETVSVVNR
jgi:uncharacterized protein (TIGR02284 family)